MPMNREVIAKEIARLEQALKQQVDRLEKLKVAKKDFGKNTLYRNIQGGLRQWRRRSRALDRIHGINAERAAQKAGSKE